MKYVYNYNGKTLEFIGSTELVVNHAGEKIIPANATEEEPLSKSKGLEDGFVNIFDKVNQVWIQIKDMRGKVYNTSNQKEVFNEIIHSLPEGYTYLEPYEDSKFDEDIGTWVDDLDAMYKREKDLIQVNYDLEEEAGLELVGISKELDGIKMDCGYGSVTKLKSGLDLNLLITSNINATMQIRTFDNNSINISNLLVEKIIKFLGINVQKRLSIKWTKQDILSLKYKDL